MDSGKRSAESFTGADHPAKRAKLEDTANLMEQDAPMDLSAAPRPSGANQPPATSQEPSVLAPEEAVIRNEVQENGFVEDYVDTDEDLEVEEFWRRRARATFTEEYMDTLMDMNPADQRPGQPLTEEEKKTFVGRPAGMSDSEDDYESLSDILDDEEYSDIWGDIC